MNEDNALLKSSKCYLCNGGELELIGVITKKPEKETDFGIDQEDYHRIICLCKHCGVYNNFHNYDFDKLYVDSYNTATYNNDILFRYNQLMNLPPASSDNKNRVERIARFFEKKRIGLEGLRALDVGSGLCVFLGELQKYGVEGHCIDPGAISINHALNNVGVKSAYQGDFFSYQSGLKFGLITFNKVLEHVDCPVSFLEKAKTFLGRGGIVYIELPDALSALNNGKLTEREEFYIEHYTIFSPDALTYLSKACGYSILESESVKEPSEKYTIYAFLACLGKQ